MRAMFSNLNVHVFNDDISIWDVSRVAITENMFGLAVAFDGDISTVGGTCREFEACTACSRVRHHLIVTVPCCALPCRELSCRR